MSLKKKKILLLCTRIIVVLQFTIIVYYSIGSKYFKNLPVKRGGGREGLFEEFAEIVRIRGGHGALWIGQSRNSRFSFGPTENL